MNPLGLLSQNSYRHFQHIGIPRALLYYRYHTLWETFFAQIGRTVVISRPTDQHILDLGNQVSLDECCLASKVYLGHVASLLDNCDAVFVPSMGNEGLHKEFCTKYQSLPDLVTNTFRHKNICVASCFVEQREQHSSMENAFISLGINFGVGASSAKRAWKTALTAQQREDRAQTQAQDETLAHLATLGKTDRLVILVVTHPYVAEDAYLGKGIATALRSMGATVLYAHQTDKERAFKESFHFSATMPWLMNRELVGSLLLLHPHVDGLVLLSAFSCGPDSMTTDAIMRCVQGKPILNLTVDGQSGTAGLETRIESFVDILRYQKHGGYLHA